MAIIEMRDLTKRFGASAAVDRLTVEVRAGAVTGLLGPNAAGKTTALRMLLGLVRPTAGVATIGGLPYHRLPHPAATVGAVLDGAHAHPGRTGRDHLRALAAAGRIAAGRVDAVLDLVGLADSAGRRVGTYSLGMRQRLALGTALLGDPRVLVLDEPTNGLDPAGVHWLRTMLRAMARDGRTVLISSHQLSELARAADDVLVMVGGRLRARLAVVGSADSLEAAYLRLTGER